MPDVAPEGDSLEFKLDNLRKIQRRFMNRWAIQTLVCVLGSEVFVNYFPDQKWLFWFMIILGFAGLLIRLCMIADAKRKILAQHNPNSFDD